jgi:FkbH-like protein
MTATVLPDPRAGYHAWHAAARALPGTARDRTVRRRLDVAVLATFSTDLLGELLAVAAARHGLALDLRLPPFGQLEQSLLDPDSPVRRDPPDYAVLGAAWQDLGLPLEGVQTPEQGAAAIARAVGRFTSLWQAAAHGAIRVVQLGVVPPAVDPYAAVSWTSPGSVSALVRAVNAELSDRASGRAVFVDVQRQAADVGLAAWEDPRYWYVGRQPCGLDALPHLATLIAGALAADAGLTRRCVVVDLDNTLWGGVLGDDGIDGVALGEGPRGEAYLAFQRYLRGLRARGIVLAVASKNDRDLVMRALAGHPRMALRPADFAVVVADWRAKSEQLAEVAGRLRLGLSALVFVDDNPAERAQVAAALPEVEVVEMPAQPSSYPAAVAATPGLFAAPALSADATRAGSYAALAAADALAARSDDLGGFLRGLAMSARIEPIDDAALPRVAQLVAKTNQFNLTTRRRSQAELAGLLAGEGWAGWTMQLRDVFADHGVVGVAIAVVDGDAATIDTLILSCRVIGRTAERSLVAAVSRWARQRGCRRLIGERSPTERNRLTADVYPRLGFAADPGRPHRFQFDLGQALVPPSPFVAEENRRV